MNDRLHLAIDDLGVLGDGIAHADGRAVFVAGTLPGESVAAKSCNDASRAELMEVLQPSVERVPLSCPHFPRCGGCRLQHMAMPSYTQWKLQQLRQLFASHGLNSLPMAKPFVALPRTRRRVRMAARRNRGITTLGFNEWRSHNIVDVSYCAVVLPELMDFITTMRSKLEAWLGEDGSCDVQVTALPGGFDVVLIGGPALGLDQRMDLAILAEALEIAKLSWRRWDRSALEPVAYRKPLTLRYNDVTVPFPPGSFLQATAESEHVLTGFAKTAVKGCTKVLDLFSGLGAFGLSLDTKADVTFVDSDGPAIQALGAAIKGMPRYRSVQRNLINNPLAAAECNDFNAVIFDPPRGGAKAQAMQLAISKVSHVVAVSCDPASFARDAKILLDGGYELTALLPVDQFLWSTHMEIAAHFVR